MQNHMRIPAILFIIFFMGSVGLARAGSSVYGNQLYDPGQLKPVDSKLKVKIGEKAPDFFLPSILGTSVRLSSYLGKKNIMLTFIPAAWTPVCSSQWPGYVLTHDLFTKYDTRVIGISTYNVPTLFAWTRDMGKVWFDVLSDFWPHGAVCSSYGLLRSNGVSDRAIILIDKKGIIRFIHVSDINVRPELGMIVKELKKLDF